MTTQIRRDRADVTVAIVFLSIPAPHKARARPAPSRTTRRALKV